MDLRDRFAARVAAALADTIVEPGALAQRAYDIADALIAERARRMDAEEERAIAGDIARSWRPPPGPDVHGVLLDGPGGYDDEIDPSWEEPPYDPSWDVEARWAAEPMHDKASSRPGLARTVPDDDEGGKERSA